MSRLFVPAVVAGLLLATTALPDDGPGVRGHALGADMARLGAGADDTAIDPGVDPSVDPDIEAACAAPADACPTDRVE